MPFDRQTSSSPPVIEQGARPGQASFRLNDGRRVAIDALSAQDAAAEQAFVARLSAESRYRRFHAGLRELSPETLFAFTHIDQLGHVALVARPASPRGEAPIVADARYVRSADCCDAEFAVAVADDWQAAGLGRELLMRLASHARAHGVKRLYGDVLWGNEPMLALARGLGAGLGRHPVDGSLLRVQFML